MAFACLLIDECDIQRYTEGAATAYGPGARTYSDHLTEQACRIMPITNPRETNWETRTGAEVADAQYKMFIASVDITEQDHVISDSVTYEVLAVAILKDGVGPQHLEVFLRTVR